MKSTFTKMTTLLSVILRYTPSTVVGEILCFSASRRTMFWAMGDVGGFDLALTICPQRKDALFFHRAASSCRAAELPASVAYDSDRILVLRSSSYTHPRAPMFKENEPFCTAKIISHSWTRLVAVAVPRVLCGFARPAWTMIFHFDEYRLAV